MYRASSFSQLPEVVKNLLIINGLLFLGKISLENYGIDLTILVPTIRLLPLDSSGRFVGDIIHYSVHLAFQRVGNFGADCS